MMARVGTKMAFGFGESGGQRCGDVDVASSWSDTLSATNQAAGIRSNAWGALVVELEGCREVASSLFAMLSAKGVLPPCHGAMWRSSRSEAACSHCTTPNGHVPGGGAAGHARLRRGCGGEGARRRPLIDHILFLFECFQCKSHGLVVFSFLLVVYPIKVTSPSSI
jgi:hypothetical protein